MKAIIRKDEQAVSPVIATILMVAITVVLAAVLYVMVSGLLVGPGASKPVLTFGTPTTSSGSTTVTIASVSQSVGRDNYRVNLRVNTTTGSAVALAHDPLGQAHAALLRDVEVPDHVDRRGRRDEGDLVNLPHPELPVLDLHDVLPAHRVARDVHRDRHRRGDTVPFLIGVTRSSLMTRPPG